jgi:hypothetical protein
MNPDIIHALETAATASTDTDAHWLLNALKNSPVRRDVKISRATHLMHLEESCFAFYRETETF